MTNPTELRRIAERFTTPSLRKSTWQLATSVGGFVATCAAMYLLVDHLSSWAALALAPLAAGFLVRIFIIQHDCGHTSFFRSRWANEVVGYACGLLTLTPFPSWRRQHAGHHRVWNDLDRRDSGADFYSSCLTVDEYQALGPWGRWRYRAVRHPLVANVLLPPLVFIVLYRFPFDMPKSWRIERRAVHLTTLALAAVIVGLGLTVGFDRVLVVQLPVMALAAMAGVWLFSVQHRSEAIAWRRHADWDRSRAALESATFLDLPRVLQWFTGNIGFHHVHHLSARVPNYRLEDCHGHIPPSVVRRLSLFGAMRCLRYALWDEDRDRMVTFREVRRLDPA